MLTIVLSIVGVVILVLLVIFIGANTRNFRDWAPPLCVGIVFLGLFGVVAGLFGPLSGYEEQVRLTEIRELVALKTEQDAAGNLQSYYAYVSATAAYSYKYKTDKKYLDEGRQFISGTITGNVTEIESKDCTIPVLKIYERKAKKSVWTFALCEPEYEYAFVVPEGGIGETEKIMLS